VSFTATIGGLTFNFSAKDLDVDLGAAQTFYSLTTPSNPFAGPHTSGPNGTEYLVMGGVGTFNIINSGAPNLEDGTFKIGPGSISATPLPSTWTMMAIGLVVLGFVVVRRSRTTPFVQAA